MGARMEAVHEALWQGVYIRPMSSDFKGLWNLSVGDGTSIPKGSTIYCTDAPCTIGKKVLFGPNPTIITGDHRIDLLGKHIADVTVEDKFVDGVNVYDQPVVIEDDVWCGANVTILKGVTIGHGSVVAAGAVVTESFPPYSIIGGIPGIIDNGKTGFLVPKHDVAVLADKIQLLLNDSVLRSNMGKVGREKFEKEFTLEVFEKRMVEILSNNVEC